MNGKTVLPAEMHPEPAALRAILDRVGEMAALPHVVFRVIEASKGSTTTAAEIERAVSVDPGFASKLLAEANTAGFAGHAKISSLREAVMRLGFDAVRNLALAVGTFNLFVGRTDAEALRRREWWMTSISTAMYAKWLANRLRCAPPDEAYTGGLLHLVGRTILDRCGGVSYTLPLDLATYRRCSLYEAEWHVYGAHTGHLGTAVGTSWGFPKAIVESMDVFTPRDDRDLVLPALVALAAVFAEHEGRTAPSPWFLATLGVSSEDLPTFYEEAKSAVEAAQMRLAS